MIDSYDDYSPLNPINQIEVEIEQEEDELEITQEALRIQTQRLNYKIWQLSKLAEIEESFKTFGFLSYDEQTEKNEILNQYLK